jgi:hypothetical protein
VRYISASDMRSKIRYSVTALWRGVIKGIFFFVITFHAITLHAEIIDRAVAYVDDTAITLSEFLENYIKIKKTVTDITEQDVINSMINRLLLIKEAKRMKLESPTDDELLRDYIDIKISSLIHIKEDAINQFYMEHINEFKGKDYLSVRDEIEKYLFEMETNRQLKRHIEELRTNAEVKIQLKDK